MLAQAYWENQLPSCGKKQSQRRLQSPRHPGIQFHVQSNLVLWLSCTVLEKLVSSSLSTSSYTSDSLATFRNYRISYYIGRSHIKPERNLHSFSSVPITGVILQCASHVTEVRQITPPPLTTQRLSPPGTLGINTWGKRASVNLRGLEVPSLWNNTREWKGAANNCVLLMCIPFLCSSKCRRPSEHTWHAPCRMPHPAVFHTASQGKPDTFQTQYDVWQYDLSQCERFSETT